MNLPAGTLNRRISIQARTGAKDEYGQRVDAWADVWDGWAAMNSSTTKTQQRFSAAGFTALVTYVFTIRYPIEFAVNSGMRLLFRNLVYDILYLEDPDGGRVRMDLYCTEINDGAA